MLERNLDLVQMLESSEADVKIYAWGKIVTVTYDRPLCFQQHCQNLNACCSRLVVRP